MADGIAAAPVLSRQIELEPNLDFDAMRRAALQHITDLSGEIWTDHNLHDPGITVLEILCYALNDVAFRARLPIQDILATRHAPPDEPGTQSSLEETRPEIPVPQTFPAQAEILSSAPVTGNDYRRLLIDRIVEVRNAWIWPAVEAREPVPGAFDVGLDLHHFPEASGAPPANPSRVEQDATALLNQNRGAGVRFRRIAVLDRRDVVLHLDARIAPDRSPIDVAAEILFRADIALNAPPVPEDLGRLLAGGTAPDHVFRGPLLRTGRIEDADMHSLNERVDDARIAGALRDLSEIAEIFSLAIDVRDPTDRRWPDLPLLPRIATHADAIKGLDLDGAPLSDRADFVGEVAASLRHREELRRYNWKLHHDTGPPATAAIGRAHREIARPRSVQHEFPKIYGLGIGAQAEDPLRIAQFRGYLAIFDQVIGDMLAQIENAPRLLSAEWPVDHSYFVQALAGPGTPANDRDAPPGFAQLIGAVGDPARIATAFDHYAKELAASASDTSRDVDRRGRALDHLLARFGESFPSAPTPPDPAALIARKEATLRNIVRFTSERGSGAVLCDHAEAVPEGAFDGPMAERIARIAGLAEIPVVVEHVHLCPGTPPVAPAPAVSIAGPDGAICLVLRGAALPEDEVDDIAASVLSDPASGSVGLYFLDADNKVIAEAVDRFSAPDKAIAAAEAVIAAEDFAPSDLPQNPCGPTVSVSLPANAAATEATRRFIEAVVSNNLPAHLTAEVLWLNPDGLSEMRRLRNRWWQELGSGATGGAEALRSALGLAFRTQRLASWSFVEEGLT
ncbi:MAG: hypothetical protein AAFU80_02085 [Pseudomonadota bacterium]